MKNIRLSLENILGEDYCKAVTAISCLLHGISEKRAKQIISEKLEFYPSSFAAQQDSLLDKVGEKITESFENKNIGAPTNSFGKAANLNASPLGAKGAFRVGEDGRLYLVSKSEHYHTPVGHNFPGFKLIDHARELGIPNATHNNTRGFITRILEKKLISTLNGLSDDDNEKLRDIMESTKSKVLNRVINLETGSLAVEAGAKMMLCRFYKLDKTFDAPKYSKKTPVFFVMADNEGGFEANYHGTTTITQTFRGMWPEIYKANEDNGIYKVVSLKINDLEDFKYKIEKYNSGQYKTAGFLHEIILMNYGGIKLEEKYLQEAYKLCEKYDTPTLVDEIQSCMWYKGMYLYRLYNLNPDFVILGKGFSGGEYPASKVITTYEMDSLNQFGALVTNGQEELASLAYLVSMTFAQENADEIEKNGEYFKAKLLSLKEKHSGIITKVEGMGHLAAIHFISVKAAVDFVEKVTGMCMDISAQVYKANCPPAALLKPPYILSKKAIDFMADKMDEALDMVKE